MLIPVQLTIKKGSKVIWHCVVEQSRATTSQDCDESLSFDFDQSGIYQFICSIHPDMLLTIVVE
jgi:plastocyanin